MSEHEKSIDIGTLITRSPGIVGGRPRIAGTGVSVRRIAVLYKTGLSPEEITDRIEHLDFAQVYAALTYYHANREEIEEDLKAERELEEKLSRQHRDQMKESA